jgi:SAM-dependent methyltransferase
MKICVSCENRFSSAGWVCPACGNEPILDGYRKLSPPLTELVQGYDPETFTAAAEAERSSFWSLQRNKLLAWTLSRYFPDARTLLEVGCGAGIVLEALEERFPELSLVGGDPFPLALDLARARLERAELLLMDGRSIPYDDEFDVVAALDVLEHVEEDEEVLRELFRAAKPGGGLLLAVPQHPRLWSRADDWALHVRRYTKHELVDKVERSGFSVVRTTSFVSITLPLMALSRALDRRKRIYDPRSELDLPRPLQAFLGSTISLERRLIAHGISLPAGGSLLLVARKPAIMQP